ncbi:hypothetical protein [Paenibacillus kobensis]|uniref:hypothetical protein n=1 Tax=Paenibacillus kobensis TaxID=59841 RepID=UPI000FDAED6B|nr:hypothetical protein [Paenibacillus kobensis]
MKKAQKFGIAVALTALSITTPLQFVPSTAQAATVKTSAAVTAIPKLKVSSKSSIQIQDFQFVYGVNEKTLYFTATIYNGDNKELDFNDYNLELYTKTGTKYKLTLQESDAKKGKVSPNTYQDLHFSASVNYQSNLSDFKFSLIKWDFSQPDYTLKVSEVSVPSGYNPIVPAVTGKVVKLNSGKKLSTILANSTFTNVAGKIEVMNTFRITNYSNTPIDLNTLSFSLKRPGGGLVKLDVDAGTTTTLLTGVSKEIKLYGVLSGTKIDNNMQLIVTETSGESKTEYPVATYTIKPITGNNSFTPAGKTAPITVEGEKVDTLIREAYYETSGDTQTLSMYVDLNNAGKSAVKLSGYTYTLLASNGALYPAINQSTDAVELSPQIKKEQYLQFSLPSNVNAENAKLIIRKTVEESKNSYILGVFGVPPKPNQETASGNSVLRMTEQGMFELSVGKVDRLPWGSEDLINADITIRNVQPSIKTIPNVKATFIINGLKVDEKNIVSIKTDTNNALESNTSSHVYISTKIPYSTTLNNVTIELSEIGSGDGTASNTKSLGRIQINASQFAPRLIKSNDTYDIIGTGRKSSLKVVQSGVYHNETNETKLVYTEFELQNKEARFAELPNLSAFFQTNTGNYIETTFKNVDTKITPNGKVLVMASAQFPESYDTSNMKFLVGQSIAGGSFLTGEGKAEGFVQGVQYELPAETTKVSTTLEKMEINPYILTLDDLSLAQEDIYDFKLNFDHTLSKWITYEKLADKHQVVFEIVDKDTRVEKAVELETGDGALKLGTDVDSSVSFHDEKLWGLLFREFTLNVYDQYQGHKKLIGTYKMNVAPSNLYL